MSGSSLPLQAYISIMIGRVSERTIVLIKGGSGFRMGKDPTVQVALKILIVGHCLITTVQLDQLFSRSGNLLKMIELN